MSACLKCGGSGAMMVGLGYPDADGDEAWDIEPCPECQPEGNLEGIAGHTPESACTSRPRPLEPRTVPPEKAARAESNSNFDERTST